MKSRRAPFMSTVTVSWNCIRRWINANAPDYPADFDKGARAAEIRAFEKTIGRKLPRDFASSLKKHTTANGVFPAPDRIWTDMAYSMMPLDRMHDRWRMMNELYDSGEFTDRHGDTKTTRGVVQQWWAPYWIPFADNGAGDYLCIDLCPTHPGHLGQVLWVSHETSIRPCLATSMESFLEQLAAGYSAGHYSVDERYGMVRANIKYFPRSKLK